jgi:hypothetical protein
VRTPSGARKDLASSSHRQDGDGLDGDPKLRAMRAVWLTMRDEEPPDRGLAELLAAARGAAETMRGRPTLWQRLVAGLRRPPALALATVMVLVGGAVILGRRGVDVPAPAASSGAPGLEVAPPAPRKESGPDLRKAEAVAEPDGSADGSADGTAKVELALERRGAADGSMKVELASKPLRPGSGKAASANASSPPPSVVVIPDRARAADGSPASGAASGVTSGAALKDTGVLEAGAVAHETPRMADAPRSTATATDGRPSRPLPASTREPAGPSEDLDGAAGVANEPPPPPPIAEAEATKKADRSEAAGAGHDKQQAAPAVSLEQLYKQCASAARRGDCAAVRLMVGRIKKSDRSYRTRVAKDAAVAKCLAE